MLIFISGISTSGKTSLGRHLVDKRKLLGEDWIFKDLDDFYKYQKPKVKLSNGKEKSNWDCFEAIDYEKVNRWLDDRYDGLTPAPNICLVGFALSRDHIKYPPDIHFHLLMDNVNLAHTVSVHRQLSKNFKGADAQDDVLMVKEVLIPFYRLYRENLDKDVKYIDVMYSNGSRKTLEGIGSYIECFLDLCVIPKK